MAKIFPPGFLWGAASSAYQAEGGIERSDWSRSHPAGRAADHYVRYEEDFELAREMGHTAHRLSVEWSRVEPREGEFDEQELEHYKRVLSSLRSANIVPVVTLWHWTLPVWAAEKGGWSNRKTIGYFERYVGVVSRTLGSQVGYWVVLNEPMNHAGLGYVAGTFPPHRRNAAAALLALEHLVSGHKAAWRVLKKETPEVPVGVSQIVNYFEPRRRWSPLDRLAVFFADLVWNQYFLRRIRREMDYVGFSYYFHDRLSWIPPFRSNAKEKVTDMGWEIYPEGMYRTALSLKSFGKPLFVLENGLADAADELREEFIRSHLSWLHRALQEGVEVIGYLHWALTDNFEWTEGFGPRFGLVEVDYGTMRRKRRPSSFFYEKVCRTNRLE